MYPERINELLGEPRLSLSGTSHWRELEQKTGITVPADFREFVDAYGPGSLNGMVRVYHPCRGATLLGEYVHLRAGEWSPVPGMHAVPVPFGVTAGRLMPVALSASGVDLLFRIEDTEPDEWHVCAFAGDTDEFVDFGYGFGEWVLRFLDGDEAVKPWFGGCGAVPPHFESALDKTA